MDQHYMDFNKNFYYDASGRLSRHEFVDKPYFTTQILGNDVINGYSVVYHYDDENRLTEVAVLDKNLNNYTDEKYSYDAKEHYLSKVLHTKYKDFVFEYTYNPHGDIVKAVTVPESQYRKNQRYIYEYDTHNNWTRCSIYFDGDGTTAPNFVIERIIEYYGK